MKTFEQRNQIIAALLPLLNEMQTKSDGTRFIAELKQPITFSDLMALNDEQLKALQKLVDSTRAAKKAQKSKQYSSLNKPNYAINDGSTTDKVNPKIVC